MNIVNDVEKVVQSIESLTYKLEISDELTLVIKNNIRVGELSEERINHLLSLMTSWTGTMQAEINLIDEITDGRFIFENAMAEYEFWNTRNKHFRTILEQLWTEKSVAKNINIIRSLSDSTFAMYTLKNFTATANVFEITYNTTVQNTKYFMDTIYEGIHAISNAPLSAVKEYFTSLYNNLNLLWLTSSFYCVKKHMERLLESISNSIADRIANTLAIPDIFRLKSSEALVLVKNCIPILDQWKDKYVKCRKVIEVLSKNYFNRWAWDFNEDILFRRINFVRIIICDLDKIMEIIELKLMSPEIGHLFNGSDQTQSFIRECITSVFFDLEINVYESNKRQIWKDVLDKFLICFENNVYDKICMSMEVSNSAINDYETLQFFENLLLRDKLIQKLYPKYEVVLQKFAVDINNFYAAFKLLKEFPRTMIDTPPVVSNIILTRDLYLRAKKAARVVESATQFPHGPKNKVLSVYGNFSKEVFAHEDYIFNQWLRNAIEIEARQMHDHLLTIRGNQLKELFYVADTALQLQLLGFSFPPIIMDLLQRRDQIKNNITAIDELVREYNKVVVKMDAPVIRAMDHHYSKVESTLRPGLENRFTYLSIKLPKYVRKSLRSLQMFNRIYDEIQSYETTISEKLELITNLTFYTINNKTNVQAISIMIDKFKIQGNENSSTITLAMSYIMEALNFIERTCYGVKSGYHERMDLFYEKYENALFEAFTVMVLNNLKAFKNILDGNRVIFLIHGQLNENKLVFIPSIRSIAYTLVKAIEDMTNKLKSVPRWMKTTNLRCPIIQDVETNEMYLPYSFYDSVMLNRKHVNDMEKKCYESIEEITLKLENIVKKFMKFNFIFEEKDKLVIDAFAMSHPTVNDYGQKMKFFSAISDELKTQSYMNVGCIRLDFSEYKYKVQAQCAFWHSIYGNQLVRECDTMMTSFSNRIKELENQLNTNFIDCQGLDVVEKSIKKIKQTVFRADSTFHNIHNRFHFLMKHKIIIPSKQLKQFQDLKTDWQNVYAEALTKGFCFENAKKGLIVTTT